MSMGSRLIRRNWRWVREVRPTMGLAFPIMAGMLAQMLMGLADTVMVGRVGVVPLAAAAFVNAMAHLPLVFGIGLLSSISVLGAQAFGAQRSRDAGEVLRHGLVMATAAGAVTALSLAALRPHLHRFGQPPEVVEAAGPYLILFGASLFPALVGHGLKQFSEAMNRPWAPNFIMLGGVLLNVFLNWILIYGNWGAPALGLEGAGWATLIARSVMALGLLLYVTGALVLQAFQPVRWCAALDPQWWRGLLRLGWPAGAQHFLEVSAFVFAALMMGWVSADAIAAHQIAITCAATTFMFPLGIALAACIRVGHAWGAGQRARLRRIGFVGIALAALVMGCFALLLAVAGEPIARLFVGSPGVVALAAQLLLVAAVFQVADGVQVAALCALRGVTDVRVPALIAVLSYWLVAVPMAYALAFPGKQGAVGIWIGLATGLGAAALALAWRFHWQTRPAVSASRILGAAKVPA